MDSQVAVALALSLVGGFSTSLGTLFPFHFRSFIFIYFLSINNPPPLFVPGIFARIYSPKNYCLFLLSIYIYIYCFWGFADDKTNARWMVFKFLSCVLVWPNFRLFLFSLQTINNGLSFSFFIFFLYHEKQEPFLWWWILPPTLRCLAFYRFFHLTSFFFF